ncbi:Repressed by EFG1 protein 1 [Rhodotorula toruloides]|nr:Repressed by EFG1 protein 1 [Rhodotorula toruloides]
MSPSANRYTGPVPTCPDSLDAKLPPDFLGEAVEVPTSEVYSAALEAAWEELGGQERALREGRRPDPERVEHLEPDPTDDSKPRPKHYGAYALERASLDWSYHVLPTKARQALQDQIVKLVIEARVRECSEAGDDEPCRVSERREGFEEGEREGRVDGVREEQMGRKGADGEEGRPLALFTAGGMGAGKGHTLREMLKTGRIRLPANTVWIDPDALSRLLPERPLYLSHSASTASSLLHPEASLLQEICAAVAKSQKRSLVIDGSLTDCKWFEGFMRGFKEKGYDCEILFVSAPLETMLARAARRAKTTGRVTNPDAIRKSRIKSPECPVTVTVTPPGGGTGGGGGGGSTDSPQGEFDLSTTDDATDSQTASFSSSPASRPSRPALTGAAGSTGASGKPGPTNSGGGNNARPSSSNSASNPSPSSSGGSTDPFASACLAAHNDFRATHHADPLTWNDTLAAAAEKWTKNCVWEHSGGKVGPYGENLFMVGPVDQNAQLDPKPGIGSWNDEEKMYDYNNPGFTHDTGHFTQTIWKATTQLGCYYGKCNGIMQSGQLGGFLVCEYYPAGNIVGDNNKYFRENVLPP